MVVYVAAEQLRAILALADIFKSHHVLIELSGLFKIADVEFDVT
jgi:hypothetical protein